MKWNHIVLVILGVWLIVSPWVLAYSALNLPSWNNILMGTLVIVFTLWNVSTIKEQ